MKAEALRISALKGFAWESTTKITVQALSWISTIVVARLLDPSSYGIVVIAMVLANLIDHVAEMGLGASLVHESRTTREQEDGVFYVTLGISIALYALLFAAAPLIAQLYKYPQLAEVIQVVGVGSILVSLRLVPAALTMQRLNFRYRSFVEMGSSVVGIVVVVWMAYAGMGVWSLVFSYLASQAVSLLAFLPALGRVPSPRFRLSAVHDLLVYGLKMMMSALMFFFYSRAPVFIAGRYVAAGALGQFTMASTLASVPLDKVGYIFNRVAFPIVSQLKTERVLARSYFLNMHRYLLIIAYPILLGLVLVGQDLITTLLTSKWAQAATLLQVICVGNLFRVSGMLAGSVLQALGRPDLALRYNVANLISVPLAAFVGIQFGLQTMTWMLVIVGVPLYLLIMNYLLREIGASFLDLFKSASPALFTSLAMVCVVLLVQSALADAATHVRLLASVTAAIAGYLLFFRTVYGELFEEVRGGFAALRSKSIASVSETL